MRRSILTSLVIIGAVVALVMGAGTFAVFTDSESISGTAQAAILDFELSGDGTNTGTNEAANDELLNISFDTTPCTWDYFAPGDDCDIPVSLTRPDVTHQLAADLTYNFSVGGIDDNAAGDLDTRVGYIAIDCDTLGSQTPDATGSGAEWHINALLTDDAGDVDFMPAAVDDTGQGMDIHVYFDSDAGNACQNNNPGTIAITITATQDPINPHTQTDTKPS